MSRDQYQRLFTFFDRELDAFEEEISLLDQIDNEEHDHVRALWEVLEARRC